MSHGFPPNYFAQFLASDLIGSPLTANQSVVMTVDAGSAIVYGVSNYTLQIPRGVE